MRRVVTSAASVVVAAAAAAAVVVAAVVVAAPVLPAAARALDLRRDPAATGAAHGRLDVAQADAEGGEAGEALEARAARHADGDRAPLGVADAERAGGAVDGGDPALVLDGQRGRSGGRRRLHLGRDRGGREGGGGEHGGGEGLEGLHGRSSWSGAMPTLWRKPVQVRARRRLR